MITTSPATIKIQTRRYRARYVDIYRSVDDGATRKHIATVEPGNSYIDNDNPCDNYAVNPIQEAPVPAPEGPGVLIDSDGLSWVKSSMPWTIATRYRNGNSSPSRTWYSFDRLAPIVYVNNLVKITRNVDFCIHDGEGGSISIEVVIWHLNKFFQQEKINAHLVFKRSTANVSYHVHEADIDIFNQLREDQELGAVLKYLGFSKPITTPDGYAQSEPKFFWEELVVKVDSQGRFIDDQLPQYNLNRHIF